MSVGITIYPGEIEREQQHQIGIEVPDRQGDLWSYCEFSPGIYAHGVVVRDFGSGDLVSASGLGTLTAAAAAGTNLLKDSGEFSGDDLRGAIGTIVEGAGIGQTFQVLEVVNADTLEIAMLTHPGGDWKTALDTTSKYRLTLPGRVKLANTSAGIRGVIQGLDRDHGFTVPTGEFRYGFVKKTGLAECVVDVSAATLASGGFVTITGTAGFITNTTSAVAAIGKCINGDLAGSVDTYQLIDLDIRNHLRSYRMPIQKEEPYRGITI